MTENVYLVEVIFDGIDDGYYGHFENVVMICKNLDTAIAYALKNADTDINAKDIKDEVEGSGEAEIWWHPMEIGSIYARRCVCRITEHALV